MKRTVSEIARDVSRLNKQEINELCETLLHKHDISATIYGFASIPTTVDERYDVYILDAGMRKLLLVKTIKELFGLGLKEAKDIVDSVPCVLKEVASKEDAEMLEQELEDSGAKVELRPI